ncbi:MAG TPA: ATP-binding protein [Gemmataceae bacterium]|nr:ATP-binding protein [Gemmataceae bacterium]
MIGLIGTRVQTVIVVSLLLGSLSVLAYSTWTTLALPQRELEARNDVQAASHEMAREARQLADTIPGKLDPNRDELDEMLRAVAARVLENYPGVEGGFFLALDDRFSGYAYPTTRHAPSNLVRNEPPPLEAPLIRRQAQQSLDDGEASLRTEDVELSRVVIFTEPVGETWPASLTTWVMVRLTGPELLEKQLRESELASFLAMGGVVLSLVLTWNLGRTLKRQRREQDRLRDELRHAEHLAGLGKMLAGVAHEVRNPLAAIRSTVQLWQRLPDSARTSESLAAVVQAVDRLAAIVSRLLLFSRVDNAERLPVDINRVLTETLNLVRAQASEQGIEIEIRLSDRLPAVSGSASALGQVLLNLITNAMQVMPSGGALTCTTAEYDGKVELVIADTGPGIGKEERTHLFEPFFTTRPDGTGLGLALCREIVTNHGGTIEYVAKDSPGATFRILLPIEVR